MKWRKMTKVVGWSPSIFRWRNLDYRWKEIRERGGREEGQVLALGGEEEVRINEGDELLKWAVTMGWAGEEEEGSGRKQQNLIMAKK